MRNDFYVYVLLDTRKPGKFVYGKSGKLNFDYEPFYVGKGRGSRCFNHDATNTSARYNKWKSNKIKRILKETGERHLIVKVAENLTEDRAFKLESQAVRIIGRKGEGPLTNLTDGGEGTVGRKDSKAVVDKRAKAIRKAIAEMPEEIKSVWYKRISQAAAARTDEEREALRIKFSAAQKNATKAELRRRSKRLSKAKLNHLATMTDSDRKRISKKLSKSSKAYWDSASTEDRAVRGELISKAICSNPKALKARNSKISDSIKKQHEALSLYDKRIRSFMVMCGVIIRNYVDNGDLDTYNVPSLKSRLRQKAERFYGKDKNLIVEARQLQPNVKSLLAA